MSRISPIRPGGIFTGGGPGTVLSGSSESTGVVEHEFLFGIRIYMNSGTQYLAHDYIGTDTVIYEGNILPDTESFCSRAIAAPAGPPQIGDFEVTVDDTAREWRGRLALETGMRRLIEIVRITDGQIVAGFEATKFSFGDGWVRIAGQDLLSKWFNVPFEGLINRVNYPYLIDGVDSDFAPIIFGLQFSSGASPQGKVRVPHIGQTTRASDSLPVDRYCMARNNLFIDLGGATIIYRKGPTDASFVVVSVAEYSITQGESLTANGQTYNMTYLDFFATQDLRSEIRCDTYGIDSINSIGTGVVSWGAPDPIRNPIDLLSYVIFEETTAMGGDVRPERYNAANFAAVRAACAAANTYCDGVIDSAITPGAFLSQWCASFEIKFFINRHYQYDVAMVTDTDPGRLVLTADFDFYAFTPSTPDVAYNRWVYRYDRTAPTGEWGQTATYDVTADQTEYGNVAYQGSTPRIAAQKVDLPWVIDGTTADATIRRRSNYERIGSNRVNFVIDLPLWFNFIDLTQLIGITDPFGLSATGYDNVEFEVLSLDDNFGTLQTTGTGILRAPVTY